MWFVIDFLLVIYFVYFISYLIQFYFYVSCECLIKEKKYIEMKLFYFVFIRCSFFFCLIIFIGFLQIFGCW